VTHVRSAEYSEVAALATVKAGLIAEFDALIHHVERWSRDPRESPWAPAIDWPQRQTPLQTRGHELA